MEFVVLVLIVLALIWVWENAIWMLFLFFSLIVLGVFIAYQHDQNKIKEKYAEIGEKLEREEKEMSLLREFIKSHSEVLLRKFRQTMYKDDYGKFVFNKWNVERNYFIDNILLAEHPMSIHIVSKSDIEREIDTIIISLHDDQDETIHSDVENITPIEFENYCADLLNDSGWEANVTCATGDQGVDIIAKKNNLRAVFQCKKYSKPVGNSAVQEIIAGRTFQNADVAAVISNASFTKSARQLADSANVHLLHFTEIVDFSPDLESSQS